MNLVPSRAHGVGAIFEAEERQALVALGSCLEVGAVAPCCVRERRHRRLRAMALRVWTPYLYTPYGNTHRITFETKLNGQPDLHYYSEYMQHATCNKVFPHARQPEARRGWFVLVMQPPSAPHCTGAVSSWCRPAPARITESVRSLESLIFSEKHTNKLLRFAYKPYTM